MLHSMIALGLIVFATACATNSDIMDTERMLTAAGFQMRLADTPAKLAQIEAMPQRTVTPRTHDGQMMFVYADAKICKCLYVGTQAADQRYARLAVIRGFQQRRQEIADEQADTAMDLETWGPWGPWY
jgi:hypothetical protein